MQKMAFDKNALLLAPLFTAILPPQSAAKRSRGARRSVERDDSGAESPTELEAKYTMTECANPALAQRVDAEMMKLA